jgi:glutaconate CoA-transferase, subunit B
MSSGASTKLNNITSPGYLDGSPGSRKKAGRLGKGPYRVINTKAILGFDDKKHRMKLLETSHGDTVADFRFQRV